MNIQSLVINFMDKEFDKFKLNFSSIMEQKISEKKAKYAVESIEKVFENPKTLNNGELNGSIIEVLKESTKQKSNIALILEDLSEVILKPIESKHILLVFDDLNEQNQISLLNNLIKSETNFNKTVDFCSRVKRKVR
jgi:hypothetical protein